MLIKNDNVLYYRQVLGVIKNCFENMKENDVQIQKSCTENITRIRLKSIVIVVSILVSGRKLYICIIYNNFSFGHKPSPGYRKCYNLNIYIDFLFLFF